MPKDFDLSPKKRDIGFWSAIVTEAPAISAYGIGNRLS
jgi:hypothetical protein